MPASAKVHKATVRTLTPQTPNVITLRLDIRLNFQPGQAIATTFPGDTQKRYFSISSAPAEGPFLELTIKVEPNSPVANAVAKLKRGDILDIEGPTGGELSVPETIASPLIFIGAGTGITPFRSIIRALLDRGEKQGIYLLHSVKTTSELLFRKDFQNWSGTKKNFHYVPTITQDSDDNWDNETGRIQDTLLFKHIPDKPNLYFLCGPTPFVNDMEKILLEKLNVQPERIRREKW